ncbi:MAG TPA: hypothetical protein VGD80_13220 [Kofleriaceae bacterium]
MKKRTSKPSTVSRCREVELGELDQIRGGAIVVSDPGGAGNEKPKDPPPSP